MEYNNRFDNWKPPKIIDGQPTEYNWIVKNKDGLKLGYKTDIGAFSYINAKYGVVIEDNVQIGSHCSLYSVSTIDNKIGKIYLKENCKVGSHTTILPVSTTYEWQ
jgi:acetyltransferase-like isoleucine patch superfamily enzyme